MFAFVFIVHEELFKGVALVRLHPIEAQAIDRLAAVVPVQHDASADSGYRQGVHLRGDRIAFRGR